MGRQKKNKPKRERAGADVRRVDPCTHIDHDAERELTDRFEALFELYTKDPSAMPPLDREHFTEDKADFFARMLCTARRMHGSAIGPIYDTEGHLNGFYGARLKTPAER